MSYLIQNLHFLESGRFLLRKMDLMAAVSEEDRLVLEWSVLPAGYNFYQAFSSLFAWCQRTFARIDRPGGTCYETLIVWRSAKERKRTMRRTWIHWLGLTGFAPLAYPNDNRMAQAVSDLSAETAPSRQLWDQLAASCDICSVMCATCAALYVSQKRVGTRLFCRVFAAVGGSAVPGAHLLRGFRGMADI